MQLLRVSYYRLAAAPVPTPAVNDGPQWKDLRKSERPFDTTLGP